MVCTIQENWQNSSQTVQENKRGNTNYQHSKERGNLIPDTTEIKRKIRCYEKLYAAASGQN